MPAIHCPEHIPVQPEPKKTWGKNIRCPNCGAPFTGKEETVTLYADGVVYAVYGPQCEYCGTMIGIK